jgi:hypothetical protein
MISSRSPQTPELSIFLPFATTRHDRKDTWNMVAEVVATICLIWAGLVILVANIGYLQLYVAAYPVSLDTRQTTLKLGKLTCFQMEILFYSQYALAVRISRLTACHCHPPRERP